MIRLLLTVALTTALLLPPAPTAADARFAIMRHAHAPGTGDPTRFALDDCTTQRNLGVRGREQAREIGAAIRAAGVTVDRILTSQWCRCRDTARLLDLPAPTGRPPSCVDSCSASRREKSSFWLPIT